MQKMECIICCTIRRYEMIRDEMHDEMQAWMIVYLRRGLPNVDSLSLCPSPYTHRRPVCLHHPSISVHPLSPSLSPSSLYLRTPAIAQSSAKLNGSGKQIVPPQRSLWEQVSSCSYMFKEDALFTPLYVSKRPSRLYIYLRVGPSLYR